MTADGKAAPEPVEWLDVLDAAGAVCGRKPRHQVHRDHDWHGLVFVWSAWMTSAGPRMLLQQRGRAGDPFSRQVDALAGGHIGAGERAEAAARRELLEEVGLGVDGVDLVRLATTRMERPTGDCRRVHQHLLLLPRRLDLTSLRFSDEVDGFVEVDLAAFAHLVHGRRPAIDARSRRVEPDGTSAARSGTLPRAAVTGYPDAILDTFRRSLGAVDQWLREGRLDACHFAGVESPLST